MDLIYDVILKPDVPKIIPEFTMNPYQKGQEKKNLALLEPSTAAFVKGILIWCHAHGIPAMLGETYRSEEEAKKIPITRTAITPGRLDWHQVGRAFHLIIKDKHGQIDKPMYTPVGEEVRKRGGVWLGDHVIHGPGGDFVDLAHFEYHPGLVLWQYRKSPLATKEVAQAEKRAARYG
jgi:hypothetical protein